MKTLILCVDRDDDLGHKANVETPLVGRRRNVEAATALGIADPEDSDTNAIFAAVNLYDRELRRAQERGHQVEVASIAGHRVVGLKSDRRLAAELDEVLELVRPDEVVLVSDGAEDEQIIPILQGRVPVAHVHRSVVKQAPRLEGFYYVLTRMLDDDKFAKRFVLPFSLVLLVWGAAFFLDILNYAWGEGDYHFQCGDDPVVGVGCGGGIGAFADGGDFGDVACFVLLAGVPVVSGKRVLGSYGGSVV